MDVKTLSQRDIRWKNIKLGFTTNTTISSHGCVITCLAMLINYLFNKNLTPADVNQSLKNVYAFSDGVHLGKGNLIVWSRVPLAFPDLKFVKRTRPYSNVDVSWYVYGRQTPVIVEVDGSVIGSDIHWVLYTGNRKLNDPFTGTVKPTSSYPEAMGYAVYTK